MTDQGPSARHDDLYTGKGWQLLDFSRLRDTPQSVAAPMTAIFLVFVFSFVVAALVLIPILVTRVFIAATEGTADDVYKTLLGLAGVFGGPIVLWRSYSAHQQAMIAKENHYTSLFTKAVELLGTTREVIDTIHDLTTHTGGKREQFTRTEPNLEVRLGAIYALERIARDSERDHWPIMEVLSAYVRNPQNCGRPIHLNEQQLSERDSFRSWLAELPDPRVDIQAVLSVIGRRPGHRRAYERRRKLRLDFEGATLQGIKLVGDFSDAIFDQCHMQNATIHDALLDRATFIATQLQGVNCSLSEFTAARFSSTKLQWSDFSRCSLVNTRFQNSDLRASRLDEIDGRGTSFQSSNLDGVTIFGAKLNSVGNLTTEQITKTYGDASTKLPPMCVRPTNWPNRQLRDHERAAFPERDLGEPQKAA
jgi:hypothetical protein